MPSFENGTCCEGSHAETRALSPPSWPFAPVYGGVRRADVERKWFLILKKKSYFPCQGIPATCSVQVWPQCGRISSDCDVLLTPGAPRHCRLLWASSVKEVQGTQETCRGHSGPKVYLVTQFSSEVIIASLEDGRMSSPWYEQSLKENSSFWTGEMG